MALEVQSTANFLTHLMRLSWRLRKHQDNNSTEAKLTNFRDSLIKALRRRYRDHWIPDKPFKGSGYRTLRITDKMDPVIAEAGNNCGLSSQYLLEIFPYLTVWVDPGEVTYRIGENDNICVLYKYNENVTEPWKPSLNNNQQPGKFKTILNQLSEKSHFYFQKCLVCLFMSSQDDN